jgi:two-component system, chemotaxis family, protein-glutamate methylesterase/glutaminase
MTMRRLRVLIVDDSVVMRRMISDMVQSDPALEVAGIAHHGHLALAKIPQLSPDLVTLDLDMPEMDGLEALSRIRAEYPHLPVLIVSALTEKGTQLTLDALAMGASDYVTKPSTILPNSSSAAEVREELIGKIKSLGAAHLSRNTGRTRGAVHPEDRSRTDIVVIGVSTGGPNALMKVLPEIPADFPVPIVVVQHMPPLFTKFLAERLEKICPLHVREAVHGDRLEPGTILIAPGDHHLEMDRTDHGVVVRLHKGPLENSCRPAVDPTFRSAVECFGSRVLGVIMTGMGQDGLQGSRCIYDGGGQILAQDEKTSVVWGMPRFVVEEGLPDEVLPLDQLAAAILKRGMVGRAGAVESQTGARR